MTPVGNIHKHRTQEGSAACAFKFVLKETDKRVEEKTLCSRDHTYIYGQLGHFDPVPSHDHSPTVAPPLIRIMPLLVQVTVLWGPVRSCMVWLWQRKSILGKRYGGRLMKKMRWMYIGGSLKFIEWSMKLSRDNRANKC